MQVTETQSEGLKRAYTVIVPAAEIESRRAARLDDLRKTLRIPGFRPGKVPPTLVRQRYGSAVAAEVLEQSVSEATQQMMTERNLRPALQPKVDLVSPETAADSAAAADLEFKVEMEVLPDITVPDLKSIALTRLKAEAGDEAIDRALQELARRQRTLEDVTEDRGAAEGDVVTIDYEGKVDDVAFPGGTGTGLDVEIGGTGFIPGFAEQLVGIRPEESRTLNVTFPEDYGEATLAGKPAAFAVTARRLRRGVVPAVDESFAEKLGFESFSEVRGLIAQQIQREYDQLARLKVKRALLDALAERADFTAPEGLVEAEFAQIWGRISAERASGQGDSEDAGKDDETLRAEYRAIADRRVRLGLLLAEIGRTSGVTVQQEELLRAMRAEAARYPGQETKVMEFFRGNPQAVESLRGPIYEDKVVDYVLELAAVTERTVTPEELARQDDDAAEGAAPEPASAAAEGDAPAA